MTRSEAWHQAERVLAVRLDALGDVLMTGPALRALKKSRPGRRITLLTSAAGAEGAALLPEVEEVIVYNAPWMKATAIQEPSGLDWEMINGLQRRFDAAVIFTVYSQSPLPAALFCCLAEIPLRLAHCRENPYQLLTDWVPETEPQLQIRHEVTRQLDLVAAIGCQELDHRLSIQIPKASRQHALGHLQKAGLDPYLPWVVVHPGASAPSRRYPPAQFAQAARRLVLDVDMQVLFTGSPAESGLTENIQNAMGVPSFSLVGKLDVSELAALIAMAPLLVANNTGPVHIAAAVGTPVIVLYALTNPQHTPWAVVHRVLNHDVSCKYCYTSICPEIHHNCLALVPPESIVEAVWSILVEAGRLGHDASSSTTVTPALMSE